MENYLLTKFVAYVQCQSQLEGLTDSEFREDARRFSSDFSLFLSWVHQYYEGLSDLEE